MRPEREALGMSLLVATALAVTALAAAAAATDRPAGPCSLAGERDGTERSSDEAQLRAATDATAVGRAGYLVAWPQASSAAGSEPLRSAGRRTR